MREIIFDTETTGLRANGGDRIIEIGAVELVNRFPTGNNFHEFVNPGDKDVHPDAQAIHGISNEMLKDKPSFKDILPKFLDYFSEGSLVAHNASFDMGFFNMEMALVKQTPFDPTRVIDTLMIARRKHPAGPNSLDALCKRYGISNAHRTLHGALLDSELLAEVYLELTGGRQAGLEFEQSEESEGDNTSGSSRRHKPQKQRPNVLASRITDEESQAHKQFEATLGEASIWKRWEKIQSDSN